MQHSSSSESIFTKIINRQIPAKIVAEDDDLIVIHDITPHAQVHLLIIPKKPIADIQSFAADEFYLGSKIFAMAQRLSREVPGAEHFRLVINNGYNAGQRVFHLHAHFLAGDIFKDHL